MDNRCPRNLSKLPETPCLEAVKRLKAIKLYGGTNIDTDILPGCPYYCFHQMSCYCSFVYMEKYCREHTVDEIAYYLMESKENVEKILTSAIEKLKNDPELRSLMNKNPIIEED